MKHILILFTLLLGFTFAQDIRVDGSSTVYPITLAAIILLFIAGLVIGVGIPAFQEGFEGYRARSSLAAMAADGFTYARDAARDYMKNAGVEEEEVTGLVHEPLTQEVGTYRTIFYFNSISGNIFSEANLRSIMNILNGTTNDVMTTDFCYKGDNVGGVCKPPFTLMDLVKTYDSSGLKDMLGKIYDGKVPGMQPSLLKRFVGADTDYKAGTGSWMQGHTLVGGPLPGWHNTSHDKNSQRRQYEDKFQRKGMLGPEPKGGGWITQIDAIIAKEEKANPDLKVYYGGAVFFPRIFGYVNIDIQYAIISLFLVAMFMWVQLGSVFLTCTG